MDVVAFPTRSAVILRGLANLILGVIAYGWPGLTLLVLIFVFAINLLITGLYMVFEPAFDKRNQHAVLTVVLGILAAVVGIYLLARPEIAASVVTLLIAFWALLFGIMDFYVGTQAHKNKINGSWFMIVTGIIAFVFGIYMLFNPIEGALSLIWAIGLFGIITGAMLLVLGMFFYPKLKGKK